VDGGEPSGFSIPVNECGSLDAVAPFPVNREGGFVFFDVEWFGVPIAGQADKLDDRPQKKTSPFACISEFERSLIVARTTEGRQRAKANGVRLSVSGDLYRRLAG
jgi:hypothetical protein